MNKLCVRSTCKVAVAASLILVLLARVPFADGLLLHDHGDQGTHSHAVTLYDMHDGDLRAAWHHHHHDSHNDNDGDGTNGSGCGEYAESLFVFVNAPAIATGVHCSSGTAIASIQHLCSKVLPRSMLSSDPTDASRFSAAPRPSAHPLRPDSALDALLQSSQALLL